MSTENLLNVEWSRGTEHSADYADKVEVFVPREWGFIVVRVRVNGEVWLEGCSDHGAIFRTAQVDADDLVGLE